MIQSQSFAIQKNGVVKGGSASYTADLETGIIEYGVILQVGVLFFTKTYKTSGQYKVDPNILKSENWKTSGTKVSVGLLDCTVTSVAVNLSQIDMLIQSQNVKGQGVISTLGDYILANSATFSGSTLGITATVILKPVSGTIYFPAVNPSGTDTFTRLNEKRVPEIARPKNQK